MKEKLFSSGEAPEDVTLNQRVANHEGQEGTVTEVITPFSVRVEFDNGDTFLYNPAQLKKILKHGEIVDVDFSQKLTGTNN
ncbi:MAG: hypothetical protein WCV73_01125 [Patescibacteria group bacterium]|jgi:hypothetical protein